MTAATLSHCSIAAMELNSRRRKRAMNPVDLSGQRLGALGGIVVLLMLLGSALVHANNAKELEIREIKPPRMKSKLISPGRSLVSLRKPAVVVSVDRGDTTYVIGETITFLIKM